MATILIPSDKWEAIFATAKPKRKVATAAKRKTHSRKDKANTGSNGRRIKRRKAMTAEPEDIEPGIYENIPFDTYLSWPFVNNTLLTHAARSLAHFRFAEQTADDEPTAAMQLGSLVHAGILEPDSLVVMPCFEDEIRREDGSKYANPKATTAYKNRVADFEAANAGKRIVSAGEYESIVGIRESLTGHKRASDYLDQGSVEVSIVWDDPDSGIRCKGRVDKWSEKECRIVDLKTTRDASEFERAIFKYGYHRQAAFYSDGMHALTGQVHEFAIAAVETDSPFCIRAAPVSDEALAAGRTEYMRLLQDIATCRSRGEWPGYQDPERWELPEWFQSHESVSLNVSGQTVTL
jgi:hypothetical protein